MCRYNRRPQNKLPVAVPVLVHAEIKEAYLLHTVAQGLPQPQMNHASRYACKTQAPYNGIHLLAYDRVVVLSDASCKKNVYFYIFSKSLFEFRIDPLNQSII